MRLFFQLQFRMAAYLAAYSTRDFKTSLWQYGESDMVLIDGRQHKSGAAIESFAKDKAP